MCRLRDSRIPLLRKLQNLGDDVRREVSDKLQLVVRVRLPVCVADADDPVTVSW